MKTAEELFDQYKNTHPIAGELLHREMFKAVIEFHDKEIIALIDGWRKEKIRLQHIELDNPTDFQDRQLINDYEVAIETLEELKQKIQ